MNIPKFTAESSLFESTNVYRNMRTNGKTIVTSSYALSPQASTNGVTPAVLTPPRGVVLSPGGGGGGSSPGYNCWEMSEGGASCRGCCFPQDLDGNTYSCWEECTDIMSSSTSRTLTPR